MGFTPKIKFVAVADLIPYVNNSRTHSEEQVAQIAASIKEFGFTNPILTDGENGIIAGHGRLMAARKLGLEKVPIIELGHLSEPQRRALIIADNKLAMNAGWDEELLKIEIEHLAADGFDTLILGWDQDEIDGILKIDVDPGGGQGDGGEVGSGTLQDKWGAPPFSILDTRQGYWRSRKKEWISLGIKSELGRGESLLSSSSQSSEQRKKRQSDSSAIRGFFPCDKSNTSLWSKEKYDGGQAWDGAGTSIFDPVLCELCYSWFSPEGGSILDPFAGGSVRGIVASRLGRHYHGVELRKNQVEANRQQADSGLVPDDKPKPSWTVGDSSKVIEKLDGGYDFVFSCPPYYDLEVYSDKDDDISNFQSYEDFIAIYKKIISDACSKLDNNRFACFVVGDIRDKKTGIYRNFVSDTISAFVDAGLKFYNEAVLINTAGTLPLRVGRQFSSMRKLGKCHQNVVVFVKGDPRKATEACGEPACVDLSSSEECDTE